MKIKTIFIILLLLMPISMFSQQLSTINTKEMSDSQIKQLLTEVNKLGMSMEDAAAMARLRGATEEQIKDIMGRMLEMKLQAEKDTLKEGRKAEGKGEKGKEEDLFSKKKKEVDTLLAEKKIFGFDLFNSENLTFEPAVNVQVPKEYMVGIGDEFIINVWGATEALYQSKVDKNGAIQISQLGPVYVNGLSFETAEKLIKNRLTRIHNGLGGSNPNTYVIINLGGLRSIQVNIVGEVQTPGSFTLPATATLFNALYLSGGPNENGTFRNIRLIRNGEIAQSVDVYDFLVNANPKANIPLRDQDIIFIPTYEKRVIVDGEFLRTGLFEVKGEESLSDLLRFNGGFKDKAYKSRIFVFRQTAKEMEVNDVGPESYPNFILQSGDSVTAGPLLDRYVNRVKIGGAVFRPGNYQLLPDMTLLDLITKAEGLQEDAYMNRALIFRLKENNDTVALSFNVTDVIEGRSVIELKREDSVSIKMNQEMREEFYVEIQGEVNDPGKKSWYNDMTVQDLIFMAGGFKENADVNVIEIAQRLSHEEAAILNDSLGHVYTISISRDLKPNADGTEFILKPFDRVLVRKAMGHRDQGSVIITGEVLYEGHFSIKNRQNRISDLIRWSGGFTPDAYLDAAHLFKADSTLVSINMQRIMDAPGSRYDMVLEPGDSLYVPKEPQTVNIVGQVQAPFATAFIPNKFVKYYVKNAGGWADSPDRKRIYVTYPDGSSQNTKGYIVLRYPQVKPGSTIVVPKKPEKERRDNSALWLATASTMSSIAVTVVTILTMLK